MSVKLGSVTIPNITVHSDGGGLGNWEDISSSFEQLGTADLDIFAIFDGTYVILSFVVNTLGTVVLHVKDNHLPLLTSEDYGAEIPYFQNDSEYSNLFCGSILYYLSMSYDGDIVHNVWMYSDVNFDPGMVGCIMYVCET